MASSEAITASHSLSVLRKRYFGLGSVSSTPSWVVPSQKIVSARVSSATGPSARPTPVETMPCTQSTLSCSTSFWKRSMVSLGLVSSSTTSSILRPAMPPAALKRSTAHCVARRPLSPALAAMPERGARMPILTGLAWAMAGAKTPATRRRRRWRRSISTRCGVKASWDVPSRGLRCAVCGGVWADDISVACQRTRESDSARRLRGQCGRIGYARGLTPCIRSP